MLTKDWLIIWGKIYPSARYDYDTFQRIGNAVFKVVAKSQLNLVQVFGRIFINDLLEFAPSLLIPGNPAESFKKLCNFHGHYFRDVKSSAKVLSSTENSATIVMAITKQDNLYPEASKAFAYQLGGCFEQLAALAIKVEVDKNITLKIQAETGQYTYIITWK